MSTATRSLSARSLSPLSLSLSLSPSLSARIEILREPIAFRELIQSAFRDHSERIAENRVRLDRAFGESQHFRTAGTCLT
jgi:hypothetical protein